MDQRREGEQDSNGDRAMEIEQYIPLIVVSEEQLTTRD